MNDPLPETNVFEVHLPKPSPRGLIVKIAAIVLGVGVIAVAAGVIINRAASPTIDPLAQIMPADTMLFLSMTTHPDQQPNYAVVADAWKGSKEAKQVESGLAVAITYAGFDWDTDIKPWLGDRAGVGLIDLGGTDQPPFFIIAIQTRDHAKSDKFLADYRQQRQTSAQGTFAIHDETYRGISIVYVSNFSQYAPYAEAFATVNDVVVVTLGPDDLKKAIDAALDGKTLATSSNFKTTMMALPGQNVGAMYMDLANYLTAASKMFDATTLETPSALLQRQQSMQQTQDMLQALGGVGLAMTYEPTGLRFDMVEQIDPSKLPEKWRSLYPTSYTAASNQIFDNIPASAFFAMNAHLPASTVQLFLDPNYWSTVFAANPNVNSADIVQKIDEFQKAAGVDLKADLLDLHNGDMAVVMMTKSNLPAPNPNAFNSFNFPFDLAALVDSSDALRTASSLDKIFGALIASSDQSGVQLQPMNRAPYTALLDQ
ncbi:MAG TPA: DUF3352 domain-containing protein, partial [Anaerolineae bacterium]|nr:DUF3352 domain-containing protein [Anaerolineae bacterium]